MCILVTEMCERLSYYSVVANLVLFCTSVLDYTSNDAATISLVFSGTVFILPIFGGYIADAVAGMYNTIYGAALIYLLGLFLLPASAVDYNDLFHGDKYELSVQNVSFAWGFLIPFLTMLLAIFFLLIARKNYIHKQLSGSTMADTLTVCWQGFRRRNVAGVGQTLAGARKQYGGSFDDKTVDGVVCVIRVLPIFFFVVIYWTVYSQMSSTFFIQGERMNLAVGDGQVPVAILNAFDTIAIMVLIPFMDRVIYPCFQRIGHPLSHLQRIGIGLVLATLSMVVAGLVEVERKEELGFEQTVGGENFNASHLSIFLQTPQFALIGASLEFAYTQSPVSMQGVMMGVFMATAGLGNYLSTAILKIVGETTKNDPWFPDEINNGHAEYLFYLLAGLIGVFFLGYLLVSRLYKYRPYQAELEQDTDDTRARLQRADIDDTAFD
nr:hypothetical protein BaRGS_013091 [Batillaria attramentaria]